MPEVLVARVGQVDPVALGFLAVLGIPLDQEGLVVPHAPVARRSEEEEVGVGVGALVQVHSAMQEEEYYNT